MDEQTRGYLAERFGEFYRNAPITPPPAADEREWGYIPFTASDGTTMVRHRSLLDVAGGPAELGSFLARESPRHVYFSAATYQRPGTRSMDEKGWNGADLVFDLDADHIPGVDADDASYRELLAACRDELQNLLDLLDRDLGFDNTTVVFSGGRGYHVHVRDDTLRGLRSEARREIVDYVRGIDLNEDGLIAKRPNERGTLQKRLRAEGGWGRRVHERLVSYTDRLRLMDEQTALAELQELDGVGEKTARTIYGVVTDNPEGVRDGNVELGPGAGTLVRALAERVVREETAPVDEPVTTDIRRLIRLPGSLHGGTGFVVRRLDPDDVASFEPWRDAIADEFRTRRIMVDVTDPGPVPFAGPDGDDSFTMSEGPQSVREFVGVFLLTRNRARKCSG